MFNVMLYCFSEILLNKGFIMFQYLGCLQDLVNKMCHSFSNYTFGLIFSFQSFEVIEKDKLSFPLG